MPAVLLPVFHHNSCLLDSPYKRLDAFWRTKRTAVPRFPNQSPTNKASKNRHQRRRGRNRHISHSKHTRRHLKHTIRQTTGVTQKVTPRIPTTVRILPVTEFLKSITGNRVDTPSFNNHLLLTGLAHQPQTQEPWLRADSGTSPALERPSLEKKINAHR